MSSQRAKAMYFQHFTLSKEPCLLMARESGSIGNGTTIVSIEHSPGWGSFFPKPRARPNEGLDLETKTWIKFFPNDTHSVIVKGLGTSSGWKGLQLKPNRSYCYSYSRSKVKVTVHFLQPWPTFSLRRWLWLKRQDISIKIKQSLLMEEVLRCTWNRCCI